MCPSIALHSEHPYPFFDRREQTTDTTVFKQHEKAIKTHHASSLKPHSLFPSLMKHIVL